MGVGGVCASAAGGCWGRDLLGVAHHPLRRPLPPSPPSFPARLLTPHSPGPSPLRLAFYTHTYAHLHPPTPPTHQPTASTHPTPPPAPPTPHPCPHLDARVVQVGEHKALCSVGVGAHHVHPHALGPLAHALVCGGGRTGLGGQLADRTRSREEDGGPGAAGQKEPPLLACRGSCWAQGTMPCGTALASALSDSPPCQALQSFARWPRFCSVPGSSSPTPSSTAQRRAALRCAVLTLLGPRALLAQLGQLRLRHRAAVALQLAILAHHAVPGHLAGEGGRGRKGVGFTGEWVHRGGVRVLVSRGRGAGTQAAPGAS